MTYGQGLGIAFWVGLVSSLIASIFTYIYLKFIDLGYVEKIREKAIEDMQNKGTSDQQIEVAMKYVKMFTSPEAMLIIGIVFGIIILVIVGLLVSIFTQKQNPQPTI